MNIVACGTGFRTISIEEVCLARGVNIVAYVDFVEDSPERTYKNPRGTNFYELLYRLFSHLGPYGKEAYRRLSIAFGFWGRIPGHVPDVLLYHDRLRGKKVIAPSKVCEEDFDYIVIAHPAYEQFRLQFSRMGVKRGKILSLVSKPRKCLRKLGKEEFLVCPRKKMENGTPSRYYNTLRLQGLARDPVPCPVPVEKQYSLVEKLVDACNLAREQVSKVPACYRTGFNWDCFMKATRGNFWQLVEQRDVKTLAEQLNHFLRNHLSTGVFGGQEVLWAFKNRFQQRYLNTIKQFHRAWAYTMTDEADLRTLGLPPIGDPCGYMIEGAILEPNCFMAHYRAALCSRLVSDSTPRPVVAEIGGGFGLFAYHLLKRNDNVLYMDFDLPENLFLESYYLSMAFPEKRILYFEDPNMQIDGSVRKDYDIILMPNFMIPALDDLSVDMFINTISFSEMDYEAIAEYMQQIQRTCKTYFYHENLADFNFSYKNYPADFFPFPEHFQEIMTAASRWPVFSLNSEEHMYIESLYMRRDSGPASLPGR